MQRSGNFSQTAKEQLLIWNKKYTYFKAIFYLGTKITEKTE